MDTIIQILARELGRARATWRTWCASLTRGNTIPFIARYRKELHGAMDDTALRTLADRLQYLQGLDKRREEVKSRHRGPGQTDGGAPPSTPPPPWRRWRISTAPYKQKRRTRATVARERGWSLWPSCSSPRPRTALRRRGPPGPLIDPEKGVETAEDALQGSQRHHRRAHLRRRGHPQRLRELVWKKGYLVSAAAAREPEDTVYRLYYAFRSP